MTEDLLEEQSEVLAKLGTSAEGAHLRARMQSACLLSDMESFKVRTHTPPWHIYFTHTHTPWNECWHTHKHRETHTERGTLTLTATQTGWVAQEPISVLRPLSQSMCQIGGRLIWFSQSLCLPRLTRWHSGGHANCVININERLLSY